MQTYFIIEVQANNDGTASIPSPLGFQVSNQTQENAMVARFFSVCAAAAESTCDMHTVKIIDNMGNVFRGYEQTLYHAQS